MVNILPQPEIFSIFKKLNYKHWYAFAEYVDNSVQNFIDWGKMPDKEFRPQKLKVNIEISDESISVEDNAHGIALKDFERAFMVARPVNNGGLHEFGMGMKTAGFWFSERWQVRTSVYGEPIERMMLFDLEDILNNQVVDIQPIEFPTTADKSYTIINLENLNQIPKGKTLTKVRSYLASMYRRQLTAGDLELTLNGEAIIWNPPGILNVPYVKGDSSENVLWRKEVTIELGGERKVQGWVGLKDTASNVDTGFALFRRGRLIQGGPNDPYSPKEICSTANKIQHMRLFGELDVQGFAATHTKDAIDWEGFEEDFIDKLKIQLRTGEFDFIHQAINYKVPRKIDPTSLEDFSPDQLLDQVGIPLPKAPEFYESITQIQREEGDQPLPDHLENSSTDYERYYEHQMENGSRWSAKVRIVDSINADLLSLSSNLVHEDNRLNGTVEIEISTSHPFFVAFADPDWQNLEPLMQFLGVLSIALGYSNFEGARSKAMLDAINRIALRWTLD